MGGKLIVAAFMILGTLGSVFPGFPGTWVVGLSLVIYSLLTHFAYIPLVWVLVGVAALVAAEVSEFAVGAAGAKRFGARRPGIVGAILGSIVGVISLGPLGMIVGPIIGAIVLELAWKRPPEEAVRAGVGATLGVLGGSVVKFLILMSVVILLLFRLF